MIRIRRRDQLASDANSVEETGGRGVAWLRGGRELRREGALIGSRQSGGALRLR
jgi:hypothetical protein